MSDLPEEPMTQTVFNPTQMDFQEHNWTQYGGFIECDGTCPMHMRHGSRIESGKMLDKKDGRFVFVNE